MQAKELIKYIKNPELLNKEAIPELQQLVKDFPYFQGGYILLSLASKKWDASVYQQSIRKTAIVVNNREHLYKLIQKAETEPEVIEKAEEKMETLLTEKVQAEPEVKVETVNEQSVAKNETVETKQETKQQETQITGEQKPDAEQLVEQEIEKSLVNAFVEKEILHTNETTSPERQDQPSNFADWLLYLKKKKPETEEEPQKEQKIQKKEAELSTHKQKQKALIDKIIDSNPGIIRHKEEQKIYKPDTKARESLLENEHLVTETLAKIYALQGNINKAIRAYEILSLKFPQKSAYFASLIQKLKEKE